jgi:hypothetical protein
MALHSKDPAQGISQFRKGKALEKGEATKAEGNWWEFTSNTKGKTVIAEAWDLPANVTKFVLE